MSDTSKRLTIGPLAFDLASLATGIATTKSLEKEIKRLQTIEKKYDAGVTQTQLLTGIFESLATLNLMMLANVAENDSDITEAAERMATKSTILLTKIAELHNIRGPKQNMLAERLRLEQHQNERGIEEAERPHERGGRER
jgi:hypothetical protein